MAQTKSISEQLKVAIVNYLSGKWDECDSGVLNTWLEQNSENRHLFGQLVDIWEADRIVRREKNFDSDLAWTRLEARLHEKVSTKTSFVVLKQFTRYAAVFIFALTLGAVGCYLINNHAESAITSSNVVEYMVPYGSKTSLQLADGSLVWLNAGTTLKYNQGFGWENRTIELAGEAWFEVAKSDNNKGLPFIVKTKEVAVMALGTKFNVKAYPEEKTIETTLLEGSVEVCNLGDGKQVLLTPHQKAVFNTDRHNFSIIEDDSDVSWFADKWIIKNRSLEAFAKLLERRYNVYFKFDDNRIRGYEFGGTIKDETIEQVLTAITYSAPVKYKIVNNHVTLSIDENKLKKYDILLKVDH